MTTFDMTEYEEDCEETKLLPPEALLIPNHPANDDYLRDVAMLKRLIVTSSNKMTPKHVEMVKKYHLGKRKVDIATEMNVTAATVGRATTSENGKKLLALLKHLALLIEGPRDGQRRHFLWRIALANELKDPRVAISAVAEINKMTHQDKALELGGNSLGGNVVQIVINNDNFPRGALD